jgi:transcriptional regulator with XRE-family HTH domain
MHNTKREWRSPMEKLIGPKRRLADHIRAGIDRHSNGRLLLAERLDISLSQVTRLLQGKRKIEATELYVIFDLLNRPLPSGRELGIETKTGKRPRKSDKLSR